MLLTEDRVSQIKEKYQISADIWPELISGSQAIAPNHKYLEWMANLIQRIGGGEEGFPHPALVTILETVSQFEKWKSHLPQKDIYQYKSLEELEGALENYRKEKTRNIKTHDESEVVYEDDRFKVVVPQSHDASCYYGSGTKWCTATKGNDTHFSNYDKEGKLFYILDKQAPTSNPHYKVALNKTYKGGESWWNAIDQSMYPSDVEHIVNHPKLLKTIEDYFQFTYAEDIAKITEKEKQQELERIAREQEWAQRRREALARANASAEERRAGDVWNPEDTDSEGMAANALMEWLKGNGDWNEDNEVEEIESQISEMRLEMEDDPDAIEVPNGERAQEYGEDLNNLEEELEVARMEVHDVYDIFLEPYDHYGLYTFAYDGAEYAVGDDDTADEAALDQVKSLIDDIGVEGFGDWVIENNIDGDDVAEEFRYSLEEDIRDCPECHLDEDYDKVLSYDGKQHQNKLEEQIADLQDQLNDEDMKEEWEDMETLIEDLENELEGLEEDEDWMEWDEEKMDDWVEGRLGEIRDDPLEELKHWGYEGDQILRFVDVDGVANDVVEADGRGNGLSGYDGDENEVHFDDEWWYIYRIN